MNIESVKNQPIQFDVNRAAIAQVRSEAMGITLASWEDEASYQLAKQKRAQVRKMHKLIEDKKKDLKADARAYLDSIETMAKELRYGLEESDLHLTRQMKVREEELAQIEARKANEKREKLEQMHARAISVNWIIPIYMLDQYLDNPEGFEAEYAKAKTLYDEQQRIKEENRIKAEAYEREQEERISKLEAENRALKQNEKLAAEVIRENAVDLSLYDQVAIEFPTLPLAWAEIVRLKAELLDATF